MYCVSQNSKNNANYNAPSPPSIWFTVGFCSALLSVTIVAGMAAPRHDDLEKKERSQHRISVYEAIDESSGEAEKPVQTITDKPKSGATYVDSSEPMKYKSRSRL